MQDFLDYVFDKRNILSIMLILSKFPYVVASISRFTKSVTASSLENAQCQNWRFVQLPSGSSQSLFARFAG